MKKLPLDPKLAYYYQQVLGIQQVMVPESYLEKKAEGEEIHFLQKTLSASWLFFVDSSYDPEQELSIQELVLKMAGALKLSEKDLSIAFIRGLEGEIPKTVEPVFRSSQKLLCFGENSKKLAEKFSMDLKPNQLNRFFKQNIGCSHSVQSLLEKPELKKETWSLMQEVARS